MKAENIYKGDGEWYLKEIADAGNIKFNLTIYAKSDL